MQVPSGVDLQRIGQGLAIPAKPALLEQLQTILAEPEPSLVAMAKLIATDLALAAAVLKTVNSPFYGLARTVSDIRQAVMFLGVTGIAGLVTGLLLKQTFQGDGAFDFDRFWDAATEIANAACYLANQFNKPLVETLYTLGLFHDCGIPLLALKFDDYGDCYRQAQQGEQPLWQLEEARYQTNHCVMGYFVASSWHLPRQLCELVLHHHDTDFLTVRQPQQMEQAWALLKMAENIVHHQRHGDSLAEWSVIEALVFEVLQIDADHYRNCQEDLEGLLV